MSNNEKIIDVVSAYNTSSGGSTVVVVPSQLNVKAGTKFCVKQDNKGRIIYEPIEKEA